MGCSDSFAVPAQTENTRPEVYYQQPYTTNSNVVYQQYPQNNENYVNTPNHSINNLNNPSKNVTHNTPEVNTNVAKPNPVENNYNRVSKQVKEPKNERVVQDTDDFEDKDYFPIFKSDLLDKEVQTITKVYSDLRDDDEDIDSQGKFHHIYITLIYRENCIDIIEIERCLSTEYKKHLKVTKIENECSMERIKPFLEKYNDEFGVDSTQWYNKNNFTNIYVKSEIEPSESINMFEIFYDKSNSKLIFNKKKTETNFTFNGTPIDANPIVLVQNYNLLKMEFIVDHSPEEVPKINSNNFANNNFGNNNSGQKIEKKGNGINIENNINILNNFANFNNGMGNIFGNGFGNNCCQFQTNFNLNQKINIELPKNRQKRVISRRNNDDKYSYEDNASNHSNHSSNSRKSGTFKNKEGFRCGGVDKDGTIRDERGFDIGKFEKDGTVKNRSGFTTAEIGDGVIKDRIGNKKLEFNNGVVRDADGNKLGEIVDGVVKDADGNKIGEVEGLTDGQAAYHHFYKDE